MVKACNFLNAYNLGGCAGDRDHWEANIDLGIGPGQGAEPGCLSLQQIQVFQSPVHKSWFMNVKDYYKMSIFKAKILPV